MHVYCFNIIIYYEIQITIIHKCFYYLYIKIKYEIIRKIKYNTVIHLIGGVTGVPI